MEESAILSSRPRVLSGMRPTGKLHLGNYMGALANWVKLQDQYECYFFIADWHALTSNYADPSEIAPNTLDVLLDYLAAGLDPAKSVLFLQSKVLQHAELNLLLGMITPVGWRACPRIRISRRIWRIRTCRTSGFWAIRC
jgi:tryptophanyl-tRNA synthetase